MGNIADLYRALVKRESISVGDIFIFTAGRDEKDPFKGKSFEVKVLDIKDGYVQYKNPDFSFCSAESSSIFMFRSMYKRKK